MSFTKMVIVFRRQPLPACIATARGFVTYVTVRVAITMPILRSINLAQLAGAMAFAKIVME
jgi:hypothetical protein